MLCQHSITDPGLFGLEVSSITAYDYCVTEKEKNYPIYTVKNFLTYSWRKLGNYICLEISCN